ncbi:tetraacyldisaccharide 4'-kinase [Botrimarina mediterranea]|uniref:tetraacyldisaccharide 4'-kinase n=1 Tax=Botrimarina mediterranea TaxID=2528022 RepID=UPI00118B8201|nr:Tetraacyldisaccharide 4'-kinase [Planctomycetes bacterium K2D]
MRSSDFYDLVSGRRRGLGAVALRGLLSLAEGPYRVGVWWRNRRYDAKPELTQRVGVPVVSVGNLTLGGSGKTPMVKWVSRQLRAEGVRVGLVSRGYGSTDGGPNDEALELEQSLPDVPHVQNRDRVAAAQLAIEELASQVIVMDDGFQHRRLGRNLDIVLLDATEPFGFGHVFPRGALREPVGSLKRADVICLTRSDLVSASDREAVRARAVKTAPDALWCESVTRPTGLIGVGDAVETEPVERLRGARVAAFCGIGNPLAFRKLLVNLGAEVAAFTEFADHHAYTRSDIERIEHETSASNAEWIVCTHKDLVKVGVATIGDLPLRALAIDAEVTVGAEELKQLLARVASEAPADEW